MRPHTVNPNSDLCDRKAEGVQPTHSLNLLLLTRDKADTKSLPDNRITSFEMLVDSK